MDMLRFLTQKLKSQSINEVTPYHPKETENDEDFNSDSEEENQELQQLNKEGRHGGQISNCCTFTPPTNAVSMCTKPHQPLEDRPCLTENVLQSLSERDRHSSEEELADIEKQCKENQAAEKRKWSQANRWSVNGESSGSSDDEVRDLCSKPVPVLFSSSPPKQLQRLRHVSPGSQVFLANVRSTAESSPRKRHRQGLGDISPHLLNRPSLDFEKMQQKMMFKKHGHGMRARVVKIRSISVSNTSRAAAPARFLCDPAVFSFRSLSTINPLTPVEDPSLAAY
ncbi:uncharacterized protein [Ptychodera flava]|uniref:uncharacterized protein n=1 Tax=Ptychodera flava TaxID=63121 RepID=UPI00396A71FE